MEIQILPESAVDLGTVMYSFPLVLFQVHEPFMEVAAEYPKAWANASYSTQELAFRGISQEDPSQISSSENRTALTVPVETSLLCGATETAVLLPAQEPVSFEDVTVNFSGEEWALLDFDQKAMYTEVMLENAKIVASIRKGSSLLWVEMGNILSRQK
ncbi:neurotrophin receptor-interacting factor 1-like [Candoia aspera]|uniref:neurotrophin receptor-interacting factor 1-like n=1 Tax=Candoia aspera TaxID=51853 RepID=UPI002FD7F914